MQLQTSTDYAIRILHYLHENKDEGLHTAMHIAETVGVTYPFFIKIANMLKQKGLLQSEQGRNGGYRLGKPAHEISIYDVYLCTEGELQINPCFKKESKTCTKEHKERCKLRRFLHSLQEDVLIASMSEMRISYLVHAVEDKMEKERANHFAAVSLEARSYAG